MMMIIIIIIIIMIIIIIIQPHSYIFMIAVEHVWTGSPIFLQRSINYNCEKFHCLFLYLFIYLIFN